MGRIGLTLAGLVLGGEEALEEVEFLLLLSEEHVHQQSLLSLQLLTDVLRHVRDHPGNQQAQEHHQVLMERERRGRQGGD